MRCSTAAAVRHRPRTPKRADPVVPVRSTGLPTALSWSRRCDPRADSQYAVAPQEQVLPLPSALSLSEGACVPENYWTVWCNLFEPLTGNLLERPAEKTLLVHGGAGGPQGYGAEFHNCCRGLPGRRSRGLYGDGSIHELVIHGCAGCRMHFDWACAALRCNAERIFCCRAGGIRTDPDGSDHAIRVHGCLFALRRRP